MTEAAYLAGIIDGEGTVAVYGREGGRSAANRLSVANTNLALIEWLITTTGCGQNVSVIDKTEQRYKTCYAWACYSEAAASLTRQIRPHLVVKAPQADLVLSFWDALEQRGRNGSYDWQEYYCNQTKVLNKRGL